MTLDLVPGPGAFFWALALTHLSGVPVRRKQLCLGEFRGDVLMVPEKCSMGLAHTSEVGCFREYLLVFLLNIFFYLHTCVSYLTVVKIVNSLLIVLFVDYSQWCFLARCHFCFYIHFSFQFLTLFSSPLSLSMWICISFSVRYWTQILFYNNKKKKILYKNKHNINDRSQGTMKDGY